MCVGGGDGGCGGGVRGLMVAAGGGCAVQCSCGLRKYKSTSCHSCTPNIAKTCSTKGDH